MAIRRVTSPHVPEPPPERWSNCLVSDGIAYVSGTIPAGTTSIRIQCMLVGTAAAAVNADFKQVTFANLTKLGL